MRAHAAMAVAESTLPATHSGEYFEFGVSLCVFAEEQESENGFIDE